jgi:hypothetical protein
MPSKILSHFRRTTLAGLWRTRVVCARIGLSSAQAAEGPFRARAVARDSKCSCSGEL